MGGVVIIGGGQGGYQCAASLRADGYEGAVTLVGDEPYLPYQRPPLSKEYLSGAKDDESLWFRPAAFYEQQDIGIITGVRAVRIERGEKVVALSDGRTLSYDYLVLATGARVRTLPVEGADLDGVISLRGLNDARDMKARFERASSCAVIGGGYIGLEVAAAACKAGLPVTVIEAEDRVLSRVAPPEISNYFERLHMNRGVVMNLGTTVTRITGEGGKAKRMHLADGRTREADLIVIGIGVTPNTELAEEAGLAVDDGIVVDAMLQTGDRAIFAIGDCAKFPCRAAGCDARLESVQNAADQGRAVARTICGKGAPYADVPWFWTIQFDVRLQTAGIPAGFDRTVERGDPDADAFSIFYYRNDALIAVDSVNQPADHMAARMMLTKGLTPPPALAGDADSDLRGWLKDAG